LWGRSPLFERLRGEDVFIALADRGLRIPHDADITSAVFRVKLEGVKNPHSVAVRPPNVAGYGRGDEAVIIESGLEARGFIVSQPAVEYAEADQVMPRA